MDSAILGAEQTMEFRCTNAARHRGGFVVAAALSCAAGAFTGGPALAEDRVPPLARATHPMDALTADEITAAMKIMQTSGKFDQTTKTVSLTMDEVPKATARAWTTGQPFARHAFAVLLKDGALIEARVDLKAGRLLDWTIVPGRQPALTIEELISAATIVQTDPRWNAAIAKRGITDPTKVACFPQATGPVVDPKLAGRRLMNVSCVDQSGTDNNLWGKPIENLLATVDTKAGTIVSFVDLGVVAPPPDTPSHDWNRSDKTRAAPKPIAIAAPAGTNVRVDGGMVRWDNWSFHVRLDPRLGIILSMIRYADEGKTRDVAYQISASEMFVPYMDPAPTWSFRSYMDIGEYGFGLLSTQLRPGRDCPASAHYLDATIADMKGAPATLKGAACIFERPTGDPLWRHDEVMNGSFEERANTELVVRMAPVVGNYDYLVDYVFDRAANLDVRLGAFGIDAGKGVASSTIADPTGKADTAYGTLVAKRLVAVNHDHYLSFRIDLDVDGTRNRLVEDVYTPRRIAEAGARRSLWRLERDTVPVEGAITTPLAAAQFRVESVGRKNAYGYPTSYQLLPGHDSTSILAADDPVQKRAGFSAHTLWATAYAPDEKFAAGAYPNGSATADGLPKWTAARRGIDGKDLVLWYTVGFRHVPRAEDWPAMPGMWHGFRLRPFNFFDRSPAMDVVPEAAPTP